MAVILVLVGAAPATASSWQPDLESAVGYAKERPGSVSIAVLDPAERFYGYRADARAPAASVFKAMLLATYLRQETVRDRPLNRRDTRLLSPMIRRSDNVTATRIRDLVGARAIRRLARRAGMGRFRLVPRPWGQSRITARDQARFFHRFETYLPERHRDYARDLLSRIVPAQRWGIGKVELGRWQLFFKGGWGSGTGRVCHQVAWIERGEERIAIAILIERSPSHRYGTETLRGISARLLGGLSRD